MHTATHDFFIQSNVLFEGRSANRVALDLWTGVSSRIATADFCMLERGICDGNLGIPRIKMPQIPGDPAGIKEFVSYLKDKGLRAMNTKIPVEKLKATQKEIKAEKAEAISEAISKGGLKGGPPLIVSSDNHILDGHHRWAGGLLAKVRKGLNVMFDAIKVNLPIRKLLDLARSYDKTEFRDLNDAPARVASRFIDRDLMTSFPEMSRVNHRGNRYAFFEGSGSKRARSRRW